MRRYVKLAAAVLAGALVLSACGGDGGDGGTGAEKQATETLKVGLAYDIGGRGDKSFNDAAARGLDRVKSELNIEVKELSASASETDADKEERLRLLAEQGYNPIIAVGFAYAPALGKVAPQFPQTKFAIVDDGTVQESNVSNLVFAEQEGSFLVGAAAALKSKSGNVGFVGGVEVPLIKKFEAGYIAGAQEVNPDVQVQVKYLTQPPDFTGFNDPAKGKEAAAGMYDSGADVVYQAAGGSGSGVFEAAQASGNLAIGVDSDQYVTADPAVRDVIMTSMLKKVDVAVFDFVKSVSDGSVKSGENIYDLAADGVGYSTSGGQVDDIKSKLDELKQQIIDGKIEVPTEP